jgi:predicted acyl esterase
VRTPSATRIRALRRLVALAGLLGTLALPAAADAAIPNIPDGAGGNISCTVQSGANAGERWCSGIFTTFDGAPIDVNVGFPPAPATGPDGDFPIIGEFHGWGGSKIAVSGQWVDAGYAYFSMSDRGWGNSCGAADPKRPQPVCQNGYNHLMDTRFEVRDAQEIFAALADRPADGATGGEGLIDPQAIGVTGGSYGGGISAALGALKDRKMIQAGDGTLIPWVSDGGKPMRIAAAQPDIPWTDLAYSLMPNGHTLDYVADAPYLKRGRIGVEKQSWVALLYAAGQALSNYAAPGTDPDADLVTWYAAINAGEPYDTNPLSQDIADEITTHHSSYYIDDSTAPAPMLFSNGFTDDLFPPDEAIRFYNRTRANHPATPISLIFTDHGHARGQNKSPDTTFRNRERHNWFDYYVKGTGPQPFQGVQTLTQTCNGPSGGATGAFDDPNTDLPFRASSWSALAPGEVRFSSPDAKVIAPDAADQNGQTFDPNGGGGACATAPSADQAGTASYRLDPAPAGGFTLMGSPTIVADVNSQSPTSQIAARLLDVDPGSGDETLVARGLYRPEINADTAPTSQVFQLHPNGWKFEPGHVAKLELLPDDQPYGRNSNGQAAVTVSNLELRLPVLDQPDGGLIQQPAPKIVPEGYELAPGYGPDNYSHPVGASPLRVSLVPAFQPCETDDANSTHGSPLDFPSCSNPNPTSSTVTVGPHSLGFARIVVCNAGSGAPFCNPAGLQKPDVRFTASVRDVKCAASLPAGQSACSSGGADYDPNGSPGPYSEGGDGSSTPAQPPCFASATSASDCLAGADLTAVAQFAGGAQDKGVRITDSDNGTFGSSPATGVNIAFPIPLDCIPTTAGDAGSTCGANTTANALMPGAVKEGDAAVWQIGEIEINDAGPDGVRGNADDQLFATQGVFLP